MSQKGLWKAHVPAPKDGIKKKAARPRKRGKMMDRSAGAGGPHSLQAGAVITRRAGRRDRTSAHGLTNNEQKLFKQKKKREEA